MNGASVKIDWNAPASTGSSPIIAYRIKILQSDTLTLSEEATNCDGTASSVISNTFCEIPMASLTSSPFSLAQGTLIQAQVEALNSIGYSTPSPLNVAGELAQTVPHKPTSGPSRGSGTTQTSLQVDFALPSAPLNGGSTILSLNLQWDAGTAGITWTTLIGESPFSTATSYTISSGIVPGTSYQFKYRAYNVHGWGSLSDSTSILAAEVPQTLAAPVTINDGTTVKISWTPLSTNGSPITAYSITIKK